jgi:hypothetical protein
MQPRLAIEWWRDMMLGRGDSRWSDAITKFGGLVPTGLFDSTEIEALPARCVHRAAGRSNDFRTLDADLFIVAVELDSGKVVRFGGEDWDDIPNLARGAGERRVARPVCAGGKCSTRAAAPAISSTGALRRTMHASTLLDRGIDLLIGVNPLVPFDASTAHRNSRRHRIAPVGRRPARRALADLPHAAAIAHAGGPVALRADLPERRPAGVRTQQRRRRAVSSPMSSASPRAAACASSPTATRWTTCASVRRSCGPVLQANGLALRKDVLADDTRSILDGLPKRPARDGNHRPPPPRPRRSRAPGRHAPLTERER